MKQKNRIEFPLFAFLFGLSIILSHFTVLPANVSCFINGALVGSGFVFIIASFLPQEIYEKLPYRKWIDRKFR